MSSPESRPPVEKEVDDGFLMRPQMADKILRFLDVAKNIEGLEGQGAAEVFANEESRRQFILHLSPENYTNLLIGINGILRNRSRSEWGMDGKDVVIGSQDHVSWDFPEFEDKQGLLAASLQAAKDIIMKNGPTEHVALVLSSAVSGIHPFDDGNGRVSKFLLAITNKGYSKDRKDMFEDVLTSQEFSNSVNVGLLQGMITSILQKEIGMKGNYEHRFNRESRLGQVTGFGSEVSVEKQELFKKQLKRSFLHMSEAIFIHFKDIIADKCLDDEGNIQLFKIIPNLTDKMIDSIIETWKFLKKKQVELIIDCIANPDKPEYQIVIPNKDGSTRTESILSIYKSKIKRSTDEVIHKKVFG